MKKKNQEKFNPQTFLHLQKILKIESLKTYKIFLIKLIKSSKISSSIAGPREIQEIVPVQESFRVQEIQEIIRVPDPIQEIVPDPTQKIAPVQEIIRVQENSNSNSLVSRLVEMSRKFRRRFVDVSRNFARRSVYFSEIFIFDFFVPVGVRVASLIQELFKI